MLPGGHVIHTILEHEWICSSAGWINGVLDQGMSSYSFYIHILFVHLLVRVLLWILKEVVGRGVLVVAVLIYV